MSLSGAASNGHSQGPLNVAGIVEEAGNFDYDADIPLRYWFRTADAILRQAQSYERDGNDQDAYLFYMRHALLASEKLPKHHDYKSPASTSARKKLQRDLLRDVDVMETLRPRINERYERYSLAIARRNAEREQWQKQHAPRASSIKDVEDFAIHTSDGRMAKRERLQLRPENGDNQVVALSLATRELKRRQGTRRQSGTMSTGRPAADEDGSDLLSQRIMETARRGEQTHTERNGRAVTGTWQPQAYHYPSVPSKQVEDSKSGSRSEVPQRPPKESFEAVKHQVQDRDTPPRLPPKEGYSSFTQSFPPLAAPPLPSKVLRSEEAPEPPSRSSTDTPEISTKDYSFVSTAVTESGKPLRTIFINPTLRFEFLKVAQPNTNRSLETCGILCGTLISNAFFISRLLIPDQTSTSDTCDTINEDQLFDYCDSHDILTLGWIHTHPTQTCFMSSRDLHTHSGYQVQMAESIAIVCAPKHEPSWGAFRLTDPPGLKTILGCRKTGLFHPHDNVEGGVYTDAMRPGHVQELKGLGFEVVDLRPEAKRR